MILGNIHVNNNNENISKSSEVETRNIIEIFSLFSTNAKRDKNYVKERVLT